jgi:hypothetical protein
MSDQPTEELLDNVSEERSRELFAEAIDEAIALHKLTGDEADTLRMASWAAYQSIDMRSLAIRLKTGKITMDDAINECKPVVATFVSAGMQSGKRLH